MKNSSYISGVRMGHGFTRDYVANQSQDINSSVAHDSASIDGSLDAGNTGWGMAFIPQSAFDPDYIDIDMAQESAVDQSLTARVKLGWTRLKNYFSLEPKSLTRPMSPLGEVFESKGFRTSKRRTSNSADYLRELTSDSMLWDDSSGGKSRSPLSEYGTTSTGAGVGSHEKQRLNGNKEASPLTSSSCGDIGSRKNAAQSAGKFTPKKYNLSQATFQFDDEDRDEDAYYF